MREREREPKDMETSERMATVAAAKADAIGHKLRDEHETEHGSQYVVDVSDVEKLIEDWPQAPRMGAKQMLEQYGVPNQATPTKLIWYRNGPWKRTIVTSYEIVLNFPTAHTDFLTQYIDYQVPVDKFDDIAAFDGSCLTDRTAGEAGARCDSEAMNMLTLNLVHDVVTGRRSVEEAREVYAENASAQTLGRSAPYTERLLFDIGVGGTGDPDEAMLAGAMAHQTVEKAKDALGADTPPPRGP